MVVQQQQRRVLVANPPLLADASQSSPCAPLPPYSVDEAVVHRKMCVVSLEHTSVHTHEVQEVGGGGRGTMIHENKNWQER